MAEGIKTEGTNIKETSFPSSSSFSLNNPYIKLSAYKLQITDDSSGNMEARIGNRNGGDVRETIPTFPLTPNPPTPVRIQTMGRVHKRRHSQTSNLQREDKTFQ
jgi:hypothetical protein